jgi:hypothetical protein
MSLAAKADRAHHGSHGCAVPSPAGNGLLRELSTRVAARYFGVITIGWLDRSRSTLRKNG